ncbi:MAG TPA: glycosyltransferase family 9 protein [Longimicrobiaceae bacterium]|nr:glycosyltransferase family 9 protein [Longimicrobiaceae bacterium]
MRRVFVLRPDNLGDVVLFSGALRHLRTLYPNAAVDLCVKRYVHDLVEACPHVDHVVHWEELHAGWPAWTRRIRGFGRLELATRRAALRLRHRPDVALLPVRSPSPEMHATLAAMPGARRYGVAGSDSNQPAEADLSVGGIYEQRLELGPERDQDHELEVTLDFLRMLGARVERADVWPELWTTEADRRWAAERLSREPGTTLLALTPGVTAPAGKAYPAARYAQALAAVPERRFRVVLMGGAGDAAVCGEVAHALAGVPSVASVENLAGRSSLREMVEGIRRCDAVLGPDSAPLHVGIALGTPTVCIVGGGHFGRFHPWGDPAVHRVVHLPMECYGCGWACRYETMRCVQEIPPSAVARELRAALSAARGAGGALACSGSGAAAPPRFERRDP